MDPILTENLESMIEDPKPLPPNCWLLLDYDSISDMETLESQLKGPGGSFEQTCLYLDPISARNWLKVAAQANYRITFHEGLHFSDVASMVAHFYKEYYKAEALDVIALGSGDGEKEVDLAQNLIQFFHSLRLLLLDVSLPLLRRALKRASDSMGTEPSVDLFGIIGNFHQIQRYIRLFSPQSMKRRRLVTMLGHTFTNLNQEIVFLQNMLAGMAIGDLFLFDFSLVAAPADQPEEVKKKEPRLNGINFGPVDRSYEQFFTSTLKRYCEGFQSAEFFSVLNDATVSISGSYTIERRAKIKAFHFPERTFTILLYKRYDLNKLIDRLRQEGLRPIKGWPFGKNKERMLYLFEKTSHLSAT